MAKSDRDNFESCVLNYINNKYFDFAVLCNGNWGIGKSYFFKNEFPLLKSHKTSKEYDSIIVSASGCSSPIEVKKRIYFEMLCHLTNKQSYEKISLEMQHYIADLIPQHLFTNRKLKPLTETFENLAKKYSELKSICENTIIIIDDLERYGDLNALEDLLAEIHVSYVENGAHIIYIADETKITCKYYKQRKEKYIRFTFTFAPDIDDIINNIINTREKLANIQNFTKLFNSRYHNEIIRNIENWKINNIRTIITAIDAFEFLVKGHPIDMLQQEHLFLTILLHTTYHVDDENSKDFYTYLESKHVSTDSWGFYDHEQDNILRYSVYSERKEINQYLAQGYLNNPTINNFFDNYYPTSNQYVATYYKLFHKYDSHEEETLKSYTNTIIEGLESKNIPFSFIVSLANITSIIKKDLPEEGTVLENSISNIVYKNQSYPERYDFMSNFSLNDYPFDYSEFTKRVLRHFTKEAESIQTKNLEQEFKKLLTDLNSEQCNIEHTGVHSAFFKFIDEKNMYNDILELSNQGLKNLSEGIKSTSKADLKEQAPYLSKLTSYIRKTIAESLTMTQMKKNRLTAFCNVADGRIADASKTDSL